MDNSKRGIGCGVIAMIIAFIIAGAFSKDYPVASGIVHAIIISIIAIIILVKIAKNVEARRKKNLPVLSGKAVIIEKERIVKSEVEGSYEYHNKVTFKNTDGGLEFIFFIPFELYATLSESDEGILEFIHDKKLGQMHFVDFICDKKGSDMTQARVIPTVSGNPMNLICTSCGGKLELDFESGIAFCPYCETEVVFIN